MCILWSVAAFDMKCHKMQPNDSVKHWMVINDHKVAFDFMPMIYDTIHLKNCLFGFGFVQMEMKENIHWFSDIHVYFVIDGNHTQRMIKHDASAIKNNSTCKFQSFQKFHLLLQIKRNLTNFKEVLVTLLRPKYPGLINRR